MGGNTSLDGGRKKAESTCRLCPEGAGRDGDAAGAPGVSRRRNCRSLLWTHASEVSKGVRAPHAVDVTVATRDFRARSTDGEKSPMKIAALLDISSLNLPSTLSAVSQQRRVSQSMAIRNRLGC